MSTRSRSQEDEPLDSWPMERLDGFISHQNVMNPEPVEDHAMSMQEFVRRHRADIDLVIRGACESTVRIDDQERARWVATDEALCDWARSVGVAMMGREQRDGTPE